MKYLIGLDNGGTTTKAALYSQTGEELCVQSVATVALTPGGGRVESDMEQLWQANCTVLRKLLDVSGVDARQVAGVAVCGHGKGLYLWGADEMPAYHAIASTDNRAEAYVRRWQRDGTQEQVYAYSYQRIMACQPVALLAWLRDNEPQVLARTKWIFACKDYIRYRLTGEAFAEFSDYSGCNLLNLQTREYDNRLLALFGLDGLREKLPPLRGACDVCGCITPIAAAQTGLCAGTPVAGGAFDIDACALSAGVLDAQNVCMIAGTWSINEYVRTAPYTASREVMNSLFAVGGQYLIEACSPTSAGNEQWLLDRLFPELYTQGNVYQTIDRQIDAIAPQTSCPLFLPFILGTNAQPDAKGCFIGLRAEHTRAHLLRGVYEGICFSHRQHYDSLLQTRDAPPQTIRLVGGAARSRVWAQMFADVMETPVETVEVAQSGALGSAICAAVAAGVWQSVPQAVQNMVRIGARIVPNPHSAAAYCRKYALYRSAVDALGGVWDKLAQYEREVPQ